MIFQGHEEYLYKFDVDMETRMLGSVRPYRRMAIISTGKSDWDFEVTWTKGSLASYLSGVKTKSMPWGSLTSSSATSPSSSDPNAPAAKPVTGVFASTSSSWLSILNGSHATLSDPTSSRGSHGPSDDTTPETVLIFPDYTLVMGVGRTQADAQALYDSSLAPGARPGNTPQEMGTWVIPYGVVVLLCKSWGLSSSAASCICDW